MDVIFLMDSPGSIARYHERLRSRCSGLLQCHSRITSFLTSIVPLATVSDVNDLASTVRGISYSGGGTYTDLALNATLDVLTDENYIRIGILLTDGQSNCPELTLIAVAAVYVHAAGIKMHTFGIGNTNRTELEAIASKILADYSSNVSSFSRSRLNKLLLLLIR